MRRCASGSRRILRRSKRGLRGRWRAGVDLGRVVFPASWAVAHCALLPSQISAAPSAAAAPAIAPPDGPEGDVGVARLVGHVLSSGHMSSPKNSFIAQSTRRKMSLLFGGGMDGTIICLAAQSPCLTVSRTLMPHGVRNLKLNRLKVIAYPLLGWL